MNIEWVSRETIVDLMVNGVNMGWVDDENEVHCMWMTYRNEDYEDERTHLIDSQYPEDHNFETREQAQAALLESAVPVYIGGFRGR